MSFSERQNFKFIPRVIEGSDSNANPQTEVNEPALRLVSSQDSVTQSLEDAQSNRSASDIYDDFQKGLISARSAHFELIDALKSGDEMSEIIASISPENEYREAEAFNILSKNILISLREMDGGATTEELIEADVFGVLGLEADPPEMSSRRKAAMWVGASVVIGLSLFPSRNVAVDSVGDGIGWVGEKIGNGEWFNVPVKIEIPESDYILEPTAQPGQ